MGSIPTFGTKYLILLDPALILVFFVALVASLLTFFSGFGLGTILLPVFLLFFSPVSAVALTAVVHFLNNLFKAFLIGRNVNLKTALVFGIPAGLGSFLGANVLLQISDEKIVYSYELLNNSYSISLIGLILGSLMIVFALFELLPALRKLNIPPKFLSLGGLLSGFFGGLSGHQGALRSAFLVKAGLDKKAFIATGVVIAIVVDIVRISSYSLDLGSYVSNYNIPLLAGASGALIGAFLGRRLIEKITITTVQSIVGIGILILGFLLAAGIIR